MEDPDIDYSELGLGSWPERVRWDVVGGLRGGLVELGFGLRRRFEWTRGSFAGEVGA